MSLATHDFFLLIGGQAGEPELFQALCDGAGWRFLRAASLAEAQATLKQSQCACAILDFEAKSLNEDALGLLRSQWPAMQIIVLSPVDDPKRGLRALKSGAYDALARPLDILSAEAALGRARASVLAAEELRAARARDDKPALIIGDSSAIRALRANLEKAAAHDNPVLLLGETGTGKALAAKALHKLSRRKRGPLVTLNCADTDPASIEAELFGQERHPVSNLPQLSKFEQAFSGTLFLDHVDFLNLDLQEKLMRALHDRGHHRLHGSTFVPIDCRVVASSAPHLKTRVDNHQFREDLFWRLSASTLTVPPLRERSEDIADLFHLFVARRCREMRRGVPVIRPEVLDAFLNHPFPGNVAELHDLAGLASSLSADEIGLADLPIPVFLRAETGGRGIDMPIKTAVHAFERQVILRTLKMVRGNQSKAAERLDIHRNTLILKMMELGIPNKKAVKKGKK